MSRRANHPLSQSTVEKQSNMADTITRKGWSVSDLATFWGVSRQYLYTIMKGQNKGELIDCALRGLPRLTKELQQRLLEDRRRNAKPRRQRKPPTIGYAAGDGVTCVEDFNSIKENEEAWILEVRGTKKAATLLVGYRTHVWELDQALFERHFVANGKVKPPVRR